MNGTASVHGVEYTIHFTGTGKHVYKDIAPGGCRFHLAKYNLVKVYPTNDPSHVLYKKVVDGLHSVVVSEPFDYGTLKYKSVSKMLEALQRNVHLTAKQAAWRAGGKELARARTGALARDLTDETIDAIERHVEKEAEKIVAALPPDAESTPEPNVFYDQVPLDSFDPTAHLASTRKLYRSGCQSMVAHFTRSVTLTGNGADYVVLETDEEDHVTIGRDSSRLVGGWFRQVGDVRTYYRSPYTAAQAA